MVAARKIELLGVTDSISGHARRHGLDRRVLWNRLFLYSWSPERACNTEVQRVAQHVARMLCAAEMRAAGVSAREIASRLGVSPGSAHRLVRSAWRTESYAFAEEWDDVLYRVPERDGRPMLYRIGGAVVVPVVVDDPFSDVRRPAMLLRREAGQWVDRRRAPDVIRAELAEWLEADDDR